jgi:hypothetical protein
MVVVLIPKVPQLERIKYLWPISLCTVILQDSIHGGVQQVEAGLMRNGLASAWTFDPGASVRTVPTQGASECLACRAHERAHQHWARAVLDIARAASLLSTRILCAIPDLLLKHPNVTVVTYERRQMKHLKQASETLTKTPEKHLKIIETYATSR